MKKDIRWKQRFENFEKSFLFLEKAVKKKKYDPLQTAGLIQTFEFTFELSWKTLKDYLEVMGIPTLFPRETIKQAFQTELISDGILWIKMLDKRNELAHTYDEKQSEMAVEIIRKEYFPCLKQVYSTLKKAADESCSD